MRAPAPVSRGRALGFDGAFDWEAMLGFFAARTVAGLETAEPGRWSRVLVLDTRSGPVAGWVRVGADAGVPRLWIGPSLRSRAATVVARVRSLFDLDHDPAAACARLGVLAQARPGLRLPGALDGFEIGVRAVLGQQISVRAAHTMAGRVVARFGTPLPDEPGRPAALRAGFPTPATIAQARPGALTDLGLTRRRAETLIALARALADGVVSLSPGTDARAAREALLALPGIGPWTVEYLAMRALRDRDAFPASDLGVLRALGVRNPREAVAAAEPWRPWRAHAVVHLWTAAAEGRPPALARPIPAAAAAARGG